jgi:hypothetical protein
MIRRRDSRRCRLYGRFSREQADPIFTPEIVLLVPDWLFGKEMRFPR